MNYTKQDLKDLVYKVNGAAIEVHKSLGPGLLESVYHKCLIRELELRNVKFQSELSIPIQYKGIEVDRAPIDYLEWLLHRSTVTLNKGETKLVNKLIESKKPHL